MEYQPRTIAYQCELLHAPQTPDPRPIQRVHNLLFESGTPEYSSFQVTPQGPVLSNPVSAPGAASLAQFLADRIRFREELGSLTPDAFGDRITRVVAGWAAECDVTQLMAQQVVVRSLVNPRSFDDARTFLAQAVLRQQDWERDFGRQPSLLGLRLVLPPEGPGEGPIALRIESFSNDPRSLFVEVSATWGGVDLTGDLAVLAARVEEGYDFMRGRVLPFLARFERS